MTTPLTPPQFGDKFSVAPTDIGSGYAAGITSAGQSIAGAIGAVMGGINQKTGEAQGGILDQKKGAEDTLDMLHQHGMLTDDEYATAKASSLTGQQKIIGMNAADFNMKLKSQLELQNQQALQAQQNQAAMARTQVGEAGATGRTQLTDEAAMARARLELQKATALNPYVRVAPTPVPGPPAKQFNFTLGQ
jgi:hypothetical protein